MSVTGDVRRGGVQADWAALRDPKGIIVKARAAGVAAPAGRERASIGC